MPSYVKLLLAIFCLLGILAILYASAWGIGLSPDSVVYIAGARSLAAGQGFSSPSWDGSPELITHHAPMYSAILASAGIAGVDPLQMAPWINAILFSMNIGLAGYLVGARLGKRESPALFFVLIGAWLILVSRTTLEIHSMAWTEPLFIASSLGSIILLGQFIESRQTKDLVLAGILTALNCLTRYVGIVLILTGLAAILLFHKSNYKQRIKFAVIHSVISALPLMIWLVNNWVRAGSATNRSIAFHPPGLDQLRLGLSTLSGWLLIPEAAPGIFKMAMILLVVGIVVYISTMRDRSPSGGLPVTFKILSLFLLLYLGFLIFSISFLDANTPLDGRLLSPILVAGICLIFSSLGWAYQNFSNKAVRILLVCVGLLLAIADLQGSLEYLRTAHTNGQGFNHRMWTDSETIQLAQELPSGIPIYSNSPGAVYIQAQHPAQRLPNRTSSVNQAANPAYLAEMGQMKSDVLTQGGIIVYFDRIQIPNYASKTELISELGYDIVEQASDGALLGMTPK